MTDLARDLVSVRRRRAVAAFVLIIASVSVGAVVGRMSASIVPAASSRTNVAARQTSEPPKPLASAAQPAPLVQPPAPQPPKLEITRDLAASGSASASPAPQFVAAAMGESQVSSTDEKGSADAGDTTTADSKMAVINPGGSEVAQGTNRSRIASERAGAGTVRAAADAERPEARFGGSEECERRYSSFRREDGTYQPHGGGPRVRCPHLR